MFATLSAAELNIQMITRKKVSCVIDATAITQLDASCVSVSKMRQSLYPLAGTSGERLRMVMNPPPTQYAHGMWGCSDPTACAAIRQVQDNPGMAAGRLDYWLSITSAR